MARVVSNQVFNALAFDHCVKCDCHHNTGELGSHCEGHYEDANLRPEDKEMPPCYMARERYPLLYEEFKRGQTKPMIPAAWRQGLTNEDIEFNTELTSERHEGDLSDEDIKNIQAKIANNANAFLNEALATRDTPEPDELAQRLLNLLIVPGLAKNASVEGERVIYVVQEYMDRVLMFNATDIGWAPKAKIEQEVASVLYRMFQNFWHEFSRLDRMMEDMADIHCGKTVESMVEEWHKETE